MPFLIDTPGDEKKPDETMLEDELAVYMGDIIIAVQKTVAGYGGIGAFSHTESQKP